MLGSTLQYHVVGAEASVLCSRTARVHHRVLWPEMTASGVLLVAPPLMNGSHADPRFFLQIEDGEKAEVYLRGGPLAMKPDHGDAMADLAVALAMQGGEKINEAMEALQKAEALGAAGNGFARRRYVYPVCTSRVWVRNLCSASGSFSVRLLERLSLRLHTANKTFCDVTIGHGRLATYGCKIMAHCLGS